MLAAAQSTDTHTTASSPDHRTELRDLAMYTSCMCVSEDRRRPAALFDGHMQRAEADVIGIRM